MSDLKHSIVTVKHFRLTANEFDKLYQETLDKINRDLQGSRCKAQGSYEKLEFGYYDCIIFVIDTGYSFLKNKYPLIYH